MATRVSLVRGETLAEIDSKVSEAQAAADASAQAAEISAAEAARAVAAEVDRATAAEADLRDEVAAVTAVTEGHDRLLPYQSVYGACGGSANAITVTTGRSGIAIGTEIRFRATAANTGPVTLNVDGSGAKPCRTITGDVLPAGYIRTTVDTVARYDGTYWVLGREIERGSNANGGYVRFADGTQICTMLATTSTSGTVSVTLPVTVLSTDYRCSIAVRSLTPCFAAISSKTTSGLDLLCWDLTGAPVSKMVELTVRSRWY